PCSACKKKYSVNRPVTANSDPASSALRRKRLVPSPRTNSARKTRGLRRNSFHAPRSSREMRLTRDSSFNKNWNSPVARGRMGGAFLKLSPILRNPAKSRAINPGCSGMEKPKFEVGATGLGELDGRGCCESHQGGAGGADA